MMHKKIGLCIKDFKTVIMEDYYYVDKTLLLKEILASGLNQFYFAYPTTGKTLAISMIQYFFEDTGNAELNIEHKNLFANTNIRSELYFQTEVCNYIVVRLDLPVTAPTLEDLLQHWKVYLSSKFHNYNEVKTVLCMEEQELFDRFINCEVTDAELFHSINFLFHCLALYKEKKCILIIDDFWANVSCAQLSGYGEEFNKFYSSFLSDILLSDGLKFAVYAGQPLYGADDFLIAESKMFDKYFSFTENETQKLLLYYGLSDRYDFVKDWCGNNKTQLFNPYLMMEFVFHVIVCEQSQDELTTRWSPIEFLLFTEKFLNNPDEYKKFALLSTGSDIRVSINSREYQFMVKCGIVTVISENADYMIVHTTNDVMIILIKRVLELQNMTKLIV